MNQVFVFGLFLSSLLFGNEYLSKELKPIKDNVARINAISDWDTVKVAELNESTEGGEAQFYYHSKNLEKVAVVYYGETGKTEATYYLYGKNLSFVVEKHYEYNRPIYWDLAHMNEYGDTAIFDGNKSEVVEDDSYFNERGILIHQLNNQDCGSPYSEDYLKKEQMRLEKDFKKLLSLQ